MCLSLSDSFCGVVLAYGSWSTHMARMVQNTLDTVDVRRIERSEGHHGNVPICIHAGGQSESVLLARSLGNPSTLPELLIEVAESKFQLAI